MMKHGLGMTVSIVLFFIAILKENVEALLVVWKTCQADRVLAGRIQYQSVRSGSPFGRQTLFLN